MPSKILDLSLFLVTIVGAVLAFKTGREQTGLRNEFARLARITGDLPVDDPSKVYIRALDTGEPLHFAWRMYVPPGYRLIVKNSSGYGSSWSQDGREFIARVRFRENKAGLLEAYTRFYGGSSQMSLGDKSFAELLRGRWDKIQVEQFGAKDLGVIEPSRSITILKLTVPPGLQEEARTKLPSSLQERFIPTLFELGIGPHALK